MYTPYGYYFKETYKDGKTIREIGTVDTPANYNNRYSKDTVNFFKGFGRCYCKADTKRYGATTFYSECNGEYFRDTFYNRLEDLIKIEHLRLVELQATSQKSFNKKAYCIYYAEKDADVYNIYNCLGLQSFDALASTVAQYSDGSLKAWSIAKFSATTTKHQKEFKKLISNFNALNN